MERIKNLLNDKYDNHVMPFLWMHGEEEAVIRRYMKEIFNAGIKSLCIESRPHKEFLQEKWWDDVSVIIDECEKLGMTLWILDDKHFPTGYASGEIQKNYKHLQKEFLSFTKFDFVGPRKNAGIILDWASGGSRPNIMAVGVENDVQDDINSEDSNIISVVAARKKSFKEIEEESLLSLTHLVKGKTLYWDMPEGEWSVYIFYTTQEGGEQATEGYLNPLIPEATDVLIDTVYESHYKHFTDKFGTVINGFFSDEPRFGNVKGPDAILGKVDMPIPWKENLEQIFSEKLGWDLNETLLNLPLLFTGESPKANEMRYQYMDMVTKLYSDNFSKRIGNWCQNHGVQYIGHVIEDNNAHSRLGYGAGHFYRSMAGQDMAGIDVVLHQLAPQQNNGYFDSFTSTGWDGEFFHFALGKMGASLGYLDPKKKGRIMCEVFGAYGWSEGIKSMLWMANHLLVRGVNYFVPHAFTMKDFPDPDCPPHFYASGKNPQFKYFHYLMGYMNRLGYLFSGGEHKSDIAVLYNAESEWSGKSMLIQKVTRQLTENQFEFDIVSADMINDCLTSTDGGFAINNKKFKLIIVPYSERLPERTVQKLLDLATKGIQIIFVDAIVEASSENTDIAAQLRELAKKIKVVSLSNICQTLTEMEADKLVLNKEVPYLRYFHYKQEEKSVYMLFNENTYEKTEFKVQFPSNNELIGYDPTLNQLRKLSSEEDFYFIELDKGEAIIIFESSDKLEIEGHREEGGEKEEKIENNLWEIDFVDADMQEVIESQGIPVLGVADQFENYSGTIVYSTTIQGVRENASLEIEDASEVVSVYINDQLIGTRISNPYHFDLSSQLNKQKNSLRIEVTNNLGRQMRDYLSQFILLDPLGISESVTLKSNLRRLTNE